MTAQPITQERRAEGASRPSFTLTDAQREYMRNEHKAEMIGLLECLAEDVVGVQGDRRPILRVLDILDKHKKRIES